MSASANVSPILQMKATDSDITKLNRFQALIKAPPSKVPPATVARMTMKVIPNKLCSAHKLLYGPLYEKDDEETRVAAVGQIIEGQRNGQPHGTWMQWQREWAARDPALAGDPLGINVCMPVIMPSDTQPPVLANRVILANAEDCEKIGRNHVKKQPNFTPFLFQSLIATTDNEHWARQRGFLNQTFLPRASLARIFPTSLARARHCAERLGQLAAQAGPHGVQMHEFYLHEAQAQLQMALFGMDEQFMESTNKRIRDVFSGNNPDMNFGKDMCLQMMEKVKSDQRFAVASEDEVRQGKKPVFGPLSKAIDNATTELDMNLVDRFGNMMLVLFAGHDTTAHTMTWLTYELARHPEIQAKLHKEVDAMFASLNGRDMTYDDCEKLPFMTRCVMETLRLWTAVPNGTFRELQYDDTVMGPGGKPVTLPKGTYVQVTNWMRQRNPTLWGADANEFNPDREWQGNEIWGKQGVTYHASNPSSPRFSPFTFSPRDCLGKNFAQMEMRTILSNVLRRWRFELTDAYSDENVRRHGPIENFGGTMGPRDLTPEGIAERERRIKTGENPRQPMAMYLKAIPRTPSANL